MLCCSLELEHINYRYKKSDRYALQEISCVFDYGYMHALTGPSGSGKTTLLSLMAGLDRPTSGDIKIDGESYITINLDRLRRERVSMIFQALNLFPKLTVMENVCYPMEMLGIPKSEAQERGTQLLQSLKIGESEYGRYPGNLSGGEQQRVAIARALSSGAKILLADEPTGNLDETNAQSVIDILRELAHGSGYCVIVVTHAELVANASDRVFSLRSGRME